MDHRITPILITLWSLVIGTASAQAKNHFKPAVFQALCSDQNLSYEEERTINALIAAELQVERVQRNRELCHKTAMSLQTSTGINLIGEGIKDLSPLATIPHLNFLYLSHNRIEDISVLAMLPSLERVDLDHNEIEDFSVLKKLRQLKKSVTKNNPGRAAWQIARKPLKRRTRSNQLVTKRASSPTTVVHHYEAPPSSTYIHVGYSQGLGHHHGHHHGHHFGHHSHHYYGRRHRHSPARHVAAALIGLGIYAAITN